MRMKAFGSERVILGSEIVPAIIVSDNGIVKEIFQGSGADVRAGVEGKYPGVEIQDFGKKILMSGVVDSHVHCNEPGRTHWEDFSTATQAAAAGGITTIIDMPLNSIPPTTTVRNFEEKLTCAKGNIFVDVGFWGGVVPGNSKELKPMLKAGVAGFKCFLIPSGTSEFRHVSLDDVEKALEELKSTESVLLFHAELEETISTKGLDPHQYATFLRTRPAAMESSAIMEVADLCKKSGVRCHIVHLSASEALPIVSEAKKCGAPLTAETCHHYLTFAAEEIPDSATLFKCCPPIRNRDNREKLWKALQDGTLDMINSDHSPCTADLKIDDFLQAWGGISSLQFGLPIAWTEARRRGIQVEQLAKWISRNPAKLSGFEKRKGDIAPGMDADFVVWDPEEIITVKTADILYKNKISPYEGRELFGKIHATILAGEFIFKDGKVVGKPVGKLLLREN
ncbi:probable allantoinase 1 [Fopius arisanus]|uniref:allantoinase n=1 Tax=Fopius arisanus TaxID=64838 RepID=A0A9R1THB6_9HYME|nr:PREDICTED: probable allantoinase 1 [Fopius arisanus]